VHILSFVPIQRPLTPRQHLILRSVARGKTNKNIAADLGISEQGVKVHISRLLERYGAENRVELVTLTRAWPEQDERAYAELSGDIAGIRAGLNRTYQDATEVGQMHGQTLGGNGHLAASVPPVKTNGHASKGGTDIAAEVRSLRDVLAEINVALKLARELPAGADVGPLVDTIRTRVGAALEQSARLDTLVDTERASHRRSRQSAS
jgi:DNA-binding CsgD family transcriptional regulator